MPPTIVDDLEPVQVDEEEGKRILLVRGRTQTLCDALNEQRAIGDPGQRIVIGHPIQTGQKVLAIRDLIPDSQETGDGLALVELRYYAQVPIEDLAVLGRQGEFVIAGNPGRKRLPQKPLQRMSSGLRQPRALAGKFAQHILVRRPVHRMKSSIDIGAPQLQVITGHDVRQVVNERVEFSSTRGKLGLHAFEGCDIACS